MMVTGNNTCGCVFLGCSFPFYKIGNFIQIVASSPKSDTVGRIPFFPVL